MNVITFKTLFFYLILLSGTTCISQIQSKHFQKKTIELTEENKKFLDEYGVVRCASIENEELLKQQFSKRASIEQFEESLAPIIAKIKADRILGKSQMVIYNIPVVVHIMHNGEPIGTAPNITDAQVISQINVFNQDFRNLIGTPGGMNSTGLAVDSEINFCLANQDENGNLTSGINRVNIGQDGVYGASSGAALSAMNALKPNSQWDPTKYMNMWSVKFTGSASSLLGYAQFPDNTPGLGGINPSGGAANTDGVVAAYHTFGSSDYDDGTFILNAPYDKGRTMTHEVGHWLGLRHIWGDNSSCTNGDFCADTPDATGSNGSCITVDSCPSDGLGNDQVQNYMDYTNDSCMDTFTQDQKDRMQAVMFSSPRRMELNASIGCEAPNPIISFSSFTQNIEEGSDCGTTDVIVTLKIGKPASANADVSINTSGTADTFDYEIIGGNLTFPAGSSNDQSFTIKIDHDSFVEADETIVLNMTLDSNGGDATVTTGAAQGKTITILNDDDIPNSTVLIDVYDEDFEDTANWSVYDVDGDGKFWGTLTGLDGYGDLIGVCAYSETDNTILGGIGNSNPDQYFVSDVFTIPSDLTNASISYYVGSYNTTGFFQENYSVYFTTISSPTAYSDLEEYVLEDERQVQTNGTEIRNHDITSFAGLTGQLVLRHHNSSTASGLLVFDTINIDATIGTSVQTILNASNPDQFNLLSSGTIYSADNLTGNVMASLTNNNGVNYECVETYVSRSTGPPVMFQINGITNYVMGKTFTIVPSTIQSSGDINVKFYFTQAEINEWISSTGNLIDDLKIIKDNGSLSTSTTTVGSFGNNITLEATFSDGINGTYYFGKNQLLSYDTASDFELFSVYPIPTNNNLNIIINTNEDVQVSLYDIRGRIIYSNLINNNRERFNTKVNVNSFSSGVYLLKVETNDGKKAIKKILIE